MNILHFILYNLYFDCFVFRVLHIYYLTTDYLFVDTNSNINDMYFITKYNKCI